MAKSPFLDAYGKSNFKKPKEDICYFRYTGKNLMGLEIDDIFTAKDEADLRDKLSKQFIKVEKVVEVSQRVYQIYFEKKRNSVVDTGHKVALEKEAIRQKQLEDGTIDPEEEIESFIDRFKKFAKEQGNA